MIRLAELSDVDEIARVHVTAWQSAYRGHIPDGYLDGLDPSQRAVVWSKAVGHQSAVVLVATVDDRLVGFCCLMPSRDMDAASAVGEISAIYVDPAVWRSGIGSALIDATVERARARKYAELTLWVLAGNSAARAFYEARGFAADGHTKTDERPGFSLHETRYRRHLAYDLTSR